MAEDVEDDWMFDSIKKYRHLLMFNLQNAAQSLAWTSDKSVCVSTSGGDKHEILELSLPEKVLTNAEAEGLCSDRDFRVVNGGLTDRCLSYLKLIPNSRYIAAADSKSNSLSVWRLGNSDSDLITQTCRVENNKKDGHPGTLDASTNRIVFGSKLSDVCLVDVETSKVITDSHDLGETDVLDKLYFIDNNTVMACCQGLCQFWLWDTRQSSKTGELHRPREATKSCSEQIWTYDCIKDSSDAKLAKIYAVERNGAMLVFDHRNLDRDSSEIRLLDFQKRASCVTNCRYFNVEVSPTSSNLLSVSGLDECVHIYDTSCAATPGVQLKAEFTHSGHMACSDQPEAIIVTSHTWHPWQPNLILSSASDGSVHGWQRELH